MLGRAQEQVNVGDEPINSRMAAATRKQKWSGGPEISFDNQKTRVPDTFQL